MPEVRGIAPAGKAATPRAVADNGTPAVPLDPETLEGLHTCAQSVDALAGRGGADSCLVATHREVADGLFGLLGDGSRTSDRCRAALSQASRRHAVWALGTLQHARDIQAVSMPPVSASLAPLDSATALLGDPAWTTTALARVTRACGAELDAPEAYGTSAGGFARCLLRADRVAADALVDAEEGPFLQPRLP